MKRCNLILIFTCATTFCTVGTAQTPAPLPPQQPPPAAVAKPAPSVRTSESAITPVMKDEARHEEFLYRIHEGGIGLLFLGDSITDFWPSRGQFSWLQYAPYNAAD